MQHQKRFSGKYHSFNAYAPNVPKNGNSQYRHRPHLTKRYDHSNVSTQHICTFNYLDYLLSYQFVSQPNKTSSLKSQILNLLQIEHTLTSPSSYTQAAMPKKKHTYILVAKQTNRTGTIITPGRNFPNTNPTSNNIHLIQNPSRYPQSIWKSYLPPIRSMHPPIFIPPQSIQYADDTIIIAEAHPRTLKVLAMILSIYANLTGLKINKDKRMFVPMAIRHTLVGVIERILGCPPTTLPITYLGLPLSAKRLTKPDYLPLIAAVERRVTSWKWALLSFGGRLTLVKAVLSAISIHFMQALKIPKWVFNHIDRIRRNFLWKYHQTCKPINCLVNWERTCSLKEEGGLGIIHL